MLNKIRKIGKIIADAISWAVVAVIGGIVAAVTAVVGVIVLGVLQVIETPVRLWNRLTGQHSKRTWYGALSQLVLTLAIAVIAELLFTAASPIVLVFTVLYWISCIEYVYDVFTGFAKTTDTSDEAASDVQITTEAEPTNPETTNADWSGSLARASENHAAFVAEVQAHTDGAKQDDPLNPADIKHVISELDKTSEDLNTGASAPDNNQQSTPAKDNVTQLDFGNTGGASLA